MDGDNVVPDLGLRVEFIQRVVHEPKRHVALRMIASDTKDNVGYMRRYHLDAMLPLVKASGRSQLHGVITRIWGFRGKSNDGHELIYGEAEVYSVTLIE